MRLYAARFENSLSNADQKELFREPENIGVRWSLDAYGVDRLEVTIRAKNKFDLYDRYNNHLGERLAIFSDWHWRPISGFVSEARPEGAGRITYIARGAGWRLEDQLDTSIYASTTTVSSALQTLLTDHAPVVASDYSHVIANATQLAGWTPELPHGNTPAEIIPVLLSKSDGTYRLYDFWLLDQPFSGAYLQKWLPYYQYRQSSTTINWQVARRDLRELSLARNINDLRTDVTVHYGTIAGTASAGGGNNSIIRSATQISDWTKDGVKPGDTAKNLTNRSRARVLTVGTSNLTVDRFEPEVTSGVATGGSTTTLVDTTKDFVALGVRVGDVLINVTKNTSITISGVATTTLTHATTTANAVGDSYRVYPSTLTGDSWSVQMQNPTQFKQQVTVSPNYWARQVVEVKAEMNSTQATQYANALLSNVPVQVQAFTVGSRYIRDGYGRRWPLWEVVAQGGGYIRLADLYPDVAHFGQSKNNMTVFIITALDYDHNARTLRVTLDNPDRRLDARLRQYGIVGTAIVGRGG